MSTCTQMSFIHLYWLPRLDPAPNHQGTRNAPEQPRRLDQAIECAPQVFMCQNINESRCSDECGGNVPDMRKVGPVVELAQI